MNSRAHSKRDRQTESPLGGQTDRDRRRQTYRQTDRQTDWDREPAGGQTDRERRIQTDKQTDSQVETVSPLGGQ